jgi:hypothetical protein
MDSNAIAEFRFIKSSTKPFSVWGQHWSALRSGGHVYICFFLTIWAWIFKEECSTGTQILWLDLGFLRYSHLWDIIIQLIRKRLKAWNYMWMVAKSLGGGGGCSAKSILFTSSGAIWII